ncbi:MAG: 2Fe-2S iron-sulfur cluster binding domain-containing protein [Nanoarchaeota archaeon]
MAKVIIEPTGAQGEVNDGDQVRDKCEELGILFGCKQGRCGTCMVEVLEGMENLLEKNEREIAMGLEPNKRLMCQAKLKEGSIRIRQY